MMISAECYINCYDVKGPTMWYPNLTGVLG